MEISCTVDIDDDRCGGESGKVNGHWKFFETFGPDFNSLKFPIRRCQSHRRSANIFLAGNSLFRLFYKNICNGHLGLYTYFRGVFPTRIPETNWD